MAKGYKVGDLDVTISGVSKDAVDSLDAVITKLDKMVGTLGVVSKGFGGAFKVNSAATRAVIGDLGDIVQTTRNATDSQQKFNAEITNGQAKAQQYSTALVVVSEAQEAVESSFRRLTALLNAPTYSRLSSDVGNLATQWKNLYTTMQRSDVADALTGGQFSQEAQNRLTRLTQEYLNKKRAIDQTNEAFKRMAMTEQELVIYDYQQEQSIRRQRMAYLEAALALDKAGENTAAFRKELEELRGEQNKTEKSTKKGSVAFSKFINQIKRIAVYRLIRALLKQITQSITETIQEFAKLDDNVNDVMSSVTSSLKIIRYSFGTTFLPLLQAIEPLLSQISVQVAEFANIISQAMATGDTYWAINSKAVEDYRKQLEKANGALFSFDKFNALNSKNNNLKFFEEREVEKSNEAVLQTKSILEDIYNLFNVLGEVATNVVGNIRKLLSPNLQYVGKFLDKIGDIISIVNAASNDITNQIIPVVEAAMPIIDDILAFAKELIQVISPFIVLVSNFVSGVVAPILQLVRPFIENDLRLLTIGIKAIAVTLSPVAYILEAILKIVQSIVTVFQDLFSFNFGKIGSDLKNIWGNWSTSNSFANSNWSNFTSSLPDKNSRFVASEVGKTVVYNNSNVYASRGNAQQMAQADYQGTIAALNEWWKTARNDIPQLQPASDTGIYQAASRGAGKAGKRFANY